MACLVYAEWLDGGRYLDGFKEKILGTGVLDEVLPYREKSV